MAAVVLIVLVALDTTPIADDYGDLSAIGHASVLQYLHGYWVSLTDRYTNAVFMVVLVKLFASAAIHIATPLLIGLLFVFCAVAVHSTRTPAPSTTDAAVVGAMAAVAIAASTPTIFDTLGWFNAVATYLAGVVAAVGTAAWMAHLAVRTTPVTRRLTAASFAFGLLAAGFTEVVGIVIFLGTLLAIANLHGLSPRGPRRRSLGAAYLAVAAGAAAGVIVILTGPGSGARTQLQHGGFNLSLIASSMRATLGWAHTNVGWRALFSVASGLACLQFTGVPRSPASARWLLMWAMFLCFVPILVVGAAVGFSGTTVAPLRTVSVATASVAVGVALITYVIASALVTAKPRLLIGLLPTAAVALSVGVVCFGTAASPVIQAELLRRTAVSERARSIRRQLRSHPRSVAVMPAPLIDFYGNAYDLFFEHKRQLGYVLGGIREYYAIPPDVAIHVIARQPRRYCLSGTEVQSYGVKSCAQLASQRRFRLSRARHN